MRKKVTMCDYNGCRKVGDFKCQMCHKDICENHHQILVFDKQRHKEAYLCLGCFKVLSPIVNHRTPKLTELYNKFKFKQALYEMIADEKWKTNGGKSETKETKDGNKNS